MYRIAEYFLEIAVLILVLIAILSPALGYSQTVTINGKQVTVEGTYSVGTPPISFWTFGNQTSVYLQSAIHGYSNAFQNDLSNNPHRHYCKASREALALASKDFWENAYLLSSGQSFIAEPTNCSLNGTSLSCSINQWFCPSGSSPCTQADVEWYVSNISSPDVSGATGYPIRVQTETYTANDPQCVIDTGIEVTCYDDQGSTTSCHFGMQGVHEAVDAGTSVYDAVLAEIGDSFHLDQSQCAANEYQRGVSTEAGDIFYCSGPCPGGTQRDLFGQCEAQALEAVCADQDGDPAVCQPEVEDVLDDIQGGDSLLRALDAQYGNGQWHLSFSQCAASDYRNFATGADDQPAAIAEFCEASCPQDTALNPSTRICEAVANIPDPLDPVAPLTGDEEFGFWDTVDAVFSTTEDTFHCTYSAGTPYVQFNGGFIQRSVDLTAYQDADPAQVTFKVVPVTYCYKQDYIATIAPRRDLDQPAPVLDTIAEPADAGTYNSDCPRGCDAYLGFPSGTSLNLLTALKYAGQTSQGYHAVDYDALGTPQPDVAWVQLSDGSWATSATAIYSSMHAECQTYLVEDGELSESGGEGVTVLSNGIYAPIVECKNFHTLPQQARFFNDGSVAVADQTVIRDRVRLSRQVTTSCPNEAECNGYSHGREVEPYVVDDGSGGGSGTGDPTSGTCTPYAGDIDPDTGEIDPSTVVECQAGYEEQQCIPTDDAGVVLYSPAIGSGLSPCPIGTDDLEGIVGGLGDAVEQANCPVASDAGGNPIIESYDDDGNPIYARDCSPNENVVNQQYVGNELDQLIARLQTYTDVSSMNGACPTFSLDLASVGLGVTTFTVECSYLELVSIVLLMMSSWTAFMMALR